MTHDEAHGAIPLFVVDADDPATRAALLAHIEECDVCRQALQEYRLAGDAIGRGVSQVTPRPELRERILAAARSAPAFQPPTISQAKTAPFTRGTWPLWAAAAAAVVAIASVAALISARVELAAQRQTLAVLASDDLQHVSLTGVAPADRAGATAFLSRTHHALVFSARDLPPLPPNRVYQLWAVAGDAPTSIGLFTTDAMGRGRLVVDFPRLSGPLAALAVTVEPQGGVPSPTGPKYLVGTLAD